MTKVLSSLFLLFILSFTAQGQLNVDDQSKIDRLFEQWNHEDSPGAALGIIQDGNLIYATGYGMSDLEHGVPIDKNSVFYIGSVSKQFVTMCILLLEEQGKLDLDDEIQKYLPDFPRYEHALTIRHFIHHTSGVRDYLTLWYLMGNDYLDHIEEDEVYELIKRQKSLNFTPGEKYLYSNSCYFMLAMIVKEASGSSLREFADKYIFSPLNMQNSHFHDDHLHLIKNRVFSYAPGKDDYQFENLIMRFDLVGSGGVYTSISDLYLWDQNFYANKLGNGGPAIIEKMHEEGILNNGKSSGYSFAIQNGEYRGLKTVSHGGALAGYRSQMMRFPDQEFSVIVLANVSNFNPTGKAYEIADVLLKGDFVTEDFTEQKETFSSVTPVKISTEELRKFCSLYWNYDESYSRKIHLLNDTLRYYRGENSESKLLPIGPNEFKMMGTSADVRVTFELSSEQRSMIVTIDGGEKITSIAYEPMNENIQELKKYMGSYYSDELNVYYDLILKDNALILWVDGNEVSAMTTVMSNLFYHDEYGTFHFAKDKAQNISGFSLDAGRVQNLQFVLK